MITHFELIGNGILLICWCEEIGADAWFPPRQSKRVVGRQPWILVKGQPFYLPQIKHVIHNSTNNSNTHIHLHTYIYVYASKEKNYDSNRPEKMQTLVTGFIGWMRVQRGLVLPLAAQLPQFKPASQLLLELEQVSPIYVEFPANLNWRWEEEEKNIILFCLSKWENRERNYLEGWRIGEEESCDEEQL